MGPKVAAWFSEQARQHGAFEVVDIDLAEVGLPLYDEPNHPRMRKYVHAHTQRWSALIDAADAVVFVVPEYNHAAPPTLMLKCAEAGSLDTPSAQATPAAASRSCSACRRRHKADSNCASLSGGAFGRNRHAKDEGASLSG